MLISTYLRFTDNNSDSGRETQTHTCRRNSRYVAGMQSFQEIYRCFGCQKNIKWTSILVNMYLFKLRILMRCTVFAVVTLLQQLRCYPEKDSGFKGIRTHDFCVTGAMYWGPFLERPGNFSGPKSHFKNHEAFDVQRFLCQPVLRLSKAYTYAVFRI